MLFPQENYIREIKILDGIWNFKTDPESIGIKNNWTNGNIPTLQVMPVPASYNDISQDSELRDYIGDVWYSKTFFVPNSWADKHIILRFGSVTHHAQVWLNGKEVCSHKGGFLPFEATIDSEVLFEKQNTLVVKVSNVLDNTCLPVGNIKTFDDEIHPKGYKIQEYHFDFFNYAGIHRPVKLYTTPKESFIKDIALTPSIDGTTGKLDYKVSAELSSNKCQVSISKSNDDSILDSKDSIEGTLIVENAEFWSPETPVLYDVTVTILSSDNKVIDTYTEKTGIRTIKATETEILLNGKPIYLKGFGKHEDSDIKGKGLDNALNCKDFNILKWMGANSFRTSHYPYSEEIMQLADQLGILIIDEVPAVGMHHFKKDSNVFSENNVNEKTLEHHLQCITDLIDRDKNHPSVIMWSLANEAATYEDNSVPYFKKVCDHSRKLDSTRPITHAHCPVVMECKVSDMFDVLCLNRYNSWYFDPGHLELIEEQLEQDLTGWHKRFKKPLIISEYGADTVVGLHSQPPVMFSEEYQVEFLKHFHNAFDKLDFVCGEHVWNFADFATKQGTARVAGNKKGVFTRNRQPKSAVYELKNRWTKM